MTAYEIIVIVLTALALLFGIVRVWIQSKTDIAKIQTEIASIKEKQKEHENDLLRNRNEFDAKLNR